MLFFFFLIFFFLGPHPRHIEVPRLGGELELQLPAYATATATSDLSPICDLHHSSWQRRILNPLSKVRGRTSNLTVPSQIHFCCAMTGIPLGALFKNSSSVRGARGLSKGIFRPAEKHLCDNVSSTPAKDIGHDELGSGKAALWVHFFFF